ncbi:MAG TPA: type IV secretory system conjugative DNA transfer family protein [Candidatus Limnocylindria bacterium]|nr:type IV secretory system conjugative DNA transfer family protein [Candidatus Limnocylindria bacterium]
MLQFDARNACTVVAGMSGSGKSTLALRYLAALYARKLTSGLFIFDPEGEFATRLKLTPSDTAEDLACAVDVEGVALFDPHTMFPGNLAEAFAWFCQWSFDTASRLPGRKLLMLDEAWKYCDRLSIPHALALCVQTGRKRGLEMLFATQLPHKLNGAVLNELTELVCFSLGEVKALECVSERGAPRAEVERLPLGSFYALNKHTRGVLRGRVF